MSLLGESEDTIVGDKGIKHTELKMPGNLRWLRFQRRWQRKKILSRCCEIYENMEINFLKNVKPWYTCWLVIFLHFYEFLLKVLQNVNSSRFIKQIITSVPASACNTPANLWFMPTHRDVCLQLWCSYATGTYRTHNAFLIKRLSRRKWFLKCDKFSSVCRLIAKRRLMWLRTDNQ